MTRWHVHKIRETINKSIKLERLLYSVIENDWLLLSDCDRILICRVICHQAPPNSFWWGLIKLNEEIL